jgi:hypothetical protein
MRGVSAKADLLKFGRVDFVSPHFWKQKNCVVSTLVPNTIPGSNPGTGRRFERLWLA